MNETLLTWIVFILTFGGVVLIHEFGHFIAARLSGIEVEEFGIGLPTPGALTLFTWKGTRFTLNWLPLGGFVRPKGENDPNIPGGLAAASPWKRLFVLFAGPFMNLASWRWIRATFAPRSRISPKSSTTVGHSASQ